MIRMGMVSVRYRIKKIKIQIKRNILWSPFSKYYCKLCKNHYTAAMSKKQPIYRTGAPVRESFKQREGKAADSPALEYLLRGEHMIIGKILRGGKKKDGQRHCRNFRGRDRADQPVYPERRNCCSYSSMRAAGLRCPHAEDGEDPRPGICGDR